MQPGVELIIVDGASPDNTPEVVAQYLLEHPQIHYFREPINSGVDADFDKAVSYARGEFCWLMGDDDLLKASAISKVLSIINSGNDDLIIVNSEVMNVNLTTKLQNQRLAFDVDKIYRETDTEAIFADIGECLSFIGCVIIRREFWLGRNRTDYYGSLFIHVGVIFQSPSITNVRVIAEPLIVIRYGNAMWTPRSFEIWMFKWPKLIWSFPDFSDSVKQKVCLREPWRSAKALFHNRALGAYTKTEFLKFYPNHIKKFDRIVAYAISIFPASLANSVMVLFFSLRAQPAQIELYDILHSRNAGLLSRFFAKFLVHEVN